MKRAFQDGPIDGVTMQELATYADDRGWLCELFRSDEPSVVPAMGYVSMSLPGVTRGPHEHARQTDRFCFVGPSPMLLVLWDNRPASATFCRRVRTVTTCGAPLLVTVPPGVVHGYRNVGSQPTYVVNLPDKLYRGPRRCEAPDEIRHETDPLSPFAFDDP